VTASLSIFSLGTLEARLEGQPLSGFEYNKVRALLAYLAVEAGQSHSRASLCTLLWPDLPESAARQNLSQALSQLRKLLGDKSAEAPFLLTTTESVQLNPTASWEVDVSPFTALLMEAEAHAHRGWQLCSPCASKLRQAIALYRGDFLAQFYLSDSDPFEEWALLLREQLRQRMLSALERLVQHDEWHGAYQQAAEIARQQVELEPLSDESQRELIRLLALSGQKAAALAQYRHLQRTLEADLGLEPEPETTALFDKIRHGTPPETLRRFQPPTSHLPTPPTRFIGREADLEAVSRLLVDSVRLLTITGAPGVGKTRLALEVAHHLRFDFEEGACFVELAPVMEAAQVPSALTQALGVKEQPGRTLEQTLQAYLQPRHILLVLDNFEHVAEAATFLAGLLSSGPGVKLLVTSRVVLRLRAEQQYPVAPLSEAEAMQLFSERAQAVRPGFRLNAENQESIAALCRQVDNLPLGIELVAVRARTFSPGELLRQLEQRLEVPTEVARDLPERQSSLRNAIAWSYHRLAEEERRLFAYLGIFAGGCTAEAAQAVAGAAGTGFGRPVPELLEALVEGSLVQTHTADETRFTMLETIREYSLEQLEALGEIDAPRRCHAEYFAEIAERTRSYRGSERQNEWYAQLSTDLDNIRTALHWTSERGEHRTMLHISVPLYHFWWYRGLVNEGLQWLEMALPYRTEASLDMQAEALINAGVLASQQNDYAKAQTYLLDGLQAARQADHQRLVRGALANLGSLALDQGEFDKVETYLVEAVSVSRAIQEEGYTRFTLTVLADLQYRQGQFAASYDSYAEALQINQQYNDQEGAADSVWGLARASRGLGQLSLAVQYCTEAEAAYRQMDHEQGVGWVLNVRAGIAHEQGQWREAVAFYREALDIRLKHDDKQGCTRVLDEAANTLVSLRRWTASVQIMGAADTARRLMGGRMTDYERWARDSLLQLCRQSLGEAAYQSAWKAGQALTLQQAVALVNL
jgi:predicted ATPase/DNA-binding SARP family transcriptional activator